MKKLIILFLLISLNAFGWTWINPDGPIFSAGDQKLCGEYGSYKVDSSFVADTIYNYDDCQSSSGVSVCNNISNPFAFKNEGIEVIKLAIRNAINYWNEAGSEHLLEYKSNGNIPIVLRHCATCDWTARALGDSWPYGYCGEDEEKLVEFDASSYSMASSSIYFALVMTHEFGDILGLGHTDENVYEDDYSEICSNLNPYCFYNRKYIMMTGDGVSELAHLTDDDKYGLRELYGKDDRSIYYVRGSFNSNGQLTLTNRTLLGSTTDYETFAQPQINALPSSNPHEFLVTWVKSDTRKINFQFREDVVGLNGDLGYYSNPIEIAGDYEVLTAPSVAINTNGTYALVVFQKVKENQAIELQEDIYFTRINLTTGTYTPIQKVTTTGLKTMSSPTVMWNNLKEKWIIFFTSRRINATDYQNWHLKYIVSNDSLSGNTVSSSDWDSTKVNFLRNTNSALLRIGWNNIVGDCGANNNCSVFFNNYENNSLKQYIVNRVDFQISSDNFTITTTAKTNLNDTITNLGHLGLTKYNGNYLLSSYLNSSRSVFDIYEINTTSTPIKKNFVDPNNTLREVYSILGHSITYRSNSILPFVAVYIEE